MRIVLPPGALTPSGREPDVLDAIMTIDNELVEWILQACPSNDDEKSEMRRVLALRTKLEQHANQIVLRRMRLATAGLEPHIARLNAVTAQISATTKAIGSAKEVIGVADEAVSIAAQVVAFVMLG